LKDIDNEAQFAELNEVLQKSERNVKALRNKSKHLNLQLQEEKAKAEAAVNRDEGMPTLLLLRESANKANSEATTAAERERQAQEQVEDLHKQRDEYREQLEEAEREYASQMEPQIKSLREETNRLSEDVEQQKQRAETIGKVCLQSFIPFVSLVLALLGTSQREVVGDVENRSEIAWRRRWNQCGRRWRACENSGMK